MVTILKNSLATEFHRFIKTQDSRLKTLDYGSEVFFCLTSWVLSLRSSLPCFFCEILWLNSYPQNVTMIMDHV